MGVFLFLFLISIPLSIVSGAFWLWYLNRVKFYFVPNSP